MKNSLLWGFLLLALVLTGWTFYRYVDLSKENARLSEERTFVIEMTNRVDIDLRIKARTIGGQLSKYPREAITNSARARGKSLLLFFASADHIFRGGVPSLNLYSSLKKSSALLKSVDVVVLLRTKDQWYARKLAEGIPNNLIALSESELSSPLLQVCPDTLMVCLLIDAKGVCVYSYIVERDDLGKDLICSRIMLNLIAADRERSNRISLVATVSDSL